MIYSRCMNRATVVVFLLLFNAPLWASELNRSIADLESAWASVYYQADESRQKQAYPELLNRAAELVKRYPNAAEPKIWYATLMATNAAFESSLTALSTLEKAKGLLEEAIGINPRALDGAAYVTLGTLYYMLPGWPVSFGDDDVAERMLQASLQINPNGIDANYFYADFLLRQDRAAEAETFFHKAVQAPVRKQQAFADTQLQNEARMALSHAQQRKANAGKSKFQALFTTASSSVSN
jgi:tetratricopeptide (TPR) repeat protein